MGPENLHLSLGDCLYPGLITSNAPCPGLTFKCPIHHHSGLFSSFSSSLILTVVHPCNLQSADHTLFHWPWPLTKSDVLSKPCHGES